MNPLNDLAGDSDGDVIQVLEDLTKERGTTITAQLVKRLTGDGATDDAQLEDNEEELDNAGYAVTVHQLRNGVRRGEYEQQKSTIDVLKAGKTVLRMWWADKDRDLWIARMLSPNRDGVTTYANSAEVADKDTWVAANNPTTANQRILFGAAKSNQSGDHSADLSNIDGTADDLHPDIVSLAKRLAKTCDPHIRPYKIKDGGEEWYVMLAGSIAFRDLQANMSTIHQNAAPRSMDENPLFRDRDLVYDGVIIKEVPEMSRTHTLGGAMIENVGASATTEVEAVFLCGAQAVIHAVAKRPSVRTDDFDYGNKSGVAVTMTRGAGKATFDSIQHGMVTAYVSAVGD
jgi:N4-gp56 family major capsid protein